LLVILLPQSFKSQAYATTPDFETKPLIKPSGDSGSVTRTRYSGKERALVQANNPD
jgi:hypothetical protein